MSTLLNPAVTFWATFQQYERVGYSASMESDAFSMHVGYERSCWNSKNGGLSK